MRKISLFVAVLLFMAAPAMAYSTVIFTCEQDANAVTVTYAVSGSTSLIRAFGLEITTDDCNIVKVDTLNPNYRIYPGQINFVEGDVNSYGTPYAEDDLGTNHITIEMGSLYTTNPAYQDDPNAGYNMIPTQSGTLLKFYTDHNYCYFVIDVNEARGGIVMEDPYEVVDINTPHLCAGYVPPPPIVAGRCGLAGGRCKPGHYRRRTYGWQYNLRAR